MIINQDIANLITELESKIGNSCYNPNSFDGYTGEEGRSFRYPVWTCQNNEDEKYYGTIKNLKPNEIETIKYKFGSNYLFIGNGLVNILQYLEERYNIDFNKLEESISNKKDISIHNNQTLLLDKSNVVPVLNVYKGFLNLNKKYTIDYRMIVKDLKTGNKYNILVAFNIKSKKYYISDEQLNFLHKNNLFPKVIFNICDEGTIPLSALELQEFSKLALYGYSVGKNGLNKKDRRTILKYVLDNKIMKAHEIISHLQGLIYFREDRSDRDFSVAIKDWKEDINFVNEYATYKQNK